MKLKTFVILLTFQIAATVYLYINFTDYVYVPITVMILFAIGADFFLLKIKKERSSSKINSDQSPKKDFNKDENGEEYHNDFSKVPGGEFDGNQPMPINYLVPDIYLELERSQDEDLKKAGLKKDQKVTEKKTNKLDV